MNKNSEIRKPTLEEKEALAKNILISGDLNDYNEALDVVNDASIAIVDNYTSEEMGGPKGKVAMVIWGGSLAFYDVYEWHVDTWEHVPCDRR